MRVFSPVLEAAFNREAVLRGIRRTFEKQFSVSEAVEENNAASVSSDEFLIPRPFGYFFGKIFFEPLTDKLMEEIAGRRLNLEKQTGQTVQVNIFFRNLSAEFELSRANLPADFFRFSIIKTFGEIAMLIERIPALKALGATNEIPKTELQRTDYNFSKQSHLTRNELAELINLSLDLKRL